MPDFDDMMNEVEEELEVQQAEQEIVDRLPQLKQLSADIDKATTAVINAKLSLESSIRQAQREEGGTRCCREYHQREGWHYQHSYW